MPIGSITDGESGADVRAKLNKALTGDQLYHARVSVSSAEILALFTTPKQLIAAPGAGKFIQIVARASMYTFATDVYAVADDTWMIYASSPSHAIAQIAAPIGEAANSVSSGAPNPGDVWPRTEIENKAIQLYATTGDPTGTGTGTLIIDLVYRIVDLP